MAHALKVAACCLSVALASCGDGTDGAPAEAAPFEQARSQQQRAPAAANLEAVRQLTRNNAEFSHALWTAEAPAGNFFFSPHSISIALAMTYAGAAGTTQQEMATTLHFAQAEPELHRTFNTLDQALAARGRNAQGADGKPFRLRVVNAAWAQHDYAFLPSYLDLLAEDYAAAINLLNFNADPDGSRRTVNSWVDARTEQRIPELLPEGVIDPSPSGEPRLRRRYAGRVRARANAYRGSGPRPSPRNGAIREHRSHAIGRAGWLDGTQPPLVPDEYLRRLLELRLVHPLAATDQVTALACARHVTRHELGGVSVRA